ncbi:MAG TPA: hypothetical protein VNJ51_08240 [Candidatus Dormibacteraeota bacterium]|nr:hypothetical protein [Candidatus Dormibacteraeota bacterium]
MSTLTEIFAPGAQPLAEGLKTLTLSPDRTAKPGDVVRVRFAFSNVGSAVATGVRVKLLLPEQGRYVAGSAAIDEEGCPDEGGTVSFLTAAGGAIHDLAPGEACGVTLEFRVEGPIEDGTQLAVQAALAADGAPVVGSNLARIAVRSRPQLRGNLTALSIEAPNGNRPGAQITVRAAIHNHGQSTAHDVTLALPIPERTSYVAGTARVDGRLLSVSGAEPFPAQEQRVVAAALAASRTLVATYDVAIAQPLADGARIAARAVVGAREEGEFELAPAALEVRSPAEFGAGTGIEVGGGEEVVPGQRVRVGLAYLNVGSGTAEDVTVSIALPEGLVYSPGSTMENGRAVADDQAVRLAEIEPGESGRMTIEAIVVSPAPTGRRLPVRAALRWRGGERAFEKTLRVRSAPEFPEAINRFELRSTASLAPGEEMAARLVVNNGGTDVARDVRVTIATAEGLEALRVRREGATLEIEDGGVRLGDMAPLDAVRLDVSARVVTPLPDKTPLSMSAKVRAIDVVESTVGSVTAHAHSRPRFPHDSQRLRLVSDLPVRPGRSVEIAYSARNEGTDVARETTLTFELPAELTLEGVEGAARRGERTLVLGAMEPGAVAAGVVRLALAAGVPTGSQLPVGARLSCANGASALLEAAEVAVTASPSFAAATLRIDPADEASPGEILTFRLDARNEGDGAAARLIVRAAPPEQTTYLPASTEINGVGVVDIGGGSPLAGGLTLADIPPEMQVIIAWRAAVNSPVAPGTELIARAHLTWDDGGADVASAATVVRSLPFFGERAPLPFSVLGVVLQPRAATAPAREAAPAVEMPPAVPSSAELAVESETLPVAQEEALPATVPVVPPPVARTEAPLVALPPLVETGEGRVAVVSSYGSDRIARAMRLISSVEAGALFPHLYAVRAFLPDRAVGGPALEDLLEGERERLHELLDHLFIKLRLPRYVVSQKDLEDRPARSALISLMRGFAEQRVPVSEPVPGGLVVLTGSIANDEAAKHADELEGAPLGGARPWRALAALLPTAGATEESLALGEALAVYRDRFVEAMRDLERMPTQEFHRVLAARSPESLDAALEQVRAAAARMGERATA